MTIVLSLTSINANATTLAQNCPAESSGTSSVMGIANEFFEALRNDDLKKFEQVTSPSFYAFDAGRKFTGDELALFVKNAHETGTRFSWSMTDPVVHLDCRTAWLTYVNKGFVEIHDSRQSATWLESMVMEYQHGQWHLQFLHSTRIPEPK